MFNEFKSFVETLNPDCVVCARISDNQLEPEDWGIDGITIRDGVVIGQLHLTNGVYTLPDMVGWTTTELVEWTQYDPTGRPEEQYNEVSREISK